MRRILWAALLALACTGSLRAFDYFAYEQITVANSAIGFTAATISAGSGHVQATVATCRLETAEVRYTVNGTTPTSSVGTLLEIGDTLTITVPELLQNFRAIRTGSTSGVLSCTYAG